MAKLNVPRPPIRTHEGGIAKRITPEQQLRRSIMACMLWEKTFYENGETVAKRIEENIKKVNPLTVVNIAKEARSKMHIRHAPLLVARIMSKLSKYKRFVSSLLYYIIQRPDELTEFIKIYWKDNPNQPLSAQVKKGLGAAMTKFDEYQISKWNKSEAEIKLRDVLLLCHPRPLGTEQSRMWKRLLENKLKPADTWETAISACGRDNVAKRKEFTRLITTGKIGGLAMIRNLRKMQEVNVPEEVIIHGIRTIRAKNILPYRFITAARHAPHLEQYLEEVMLRSLGEVNKLMGHTVLLLDVSWSMDKPLSYRKDPRTGEMKPSEMKRADAAYGLAILLREVCDRVDVFTFSNRIVRVAPRRGFALRDAVTKSQAHSGTYLGASVKSIYNQNLVSVQTNRLNFMHSSPHYNGIKFPGYGMRPDRLIVITDEQSKDKVPDPIGRGYMLNVGTDKNGVGYGKWLHIDGFSEASVKYITEYESYEEM